MPQKPCLLIADDYALTPCISNSILQLIDLGRLSGTGAMVTGPHWPDFAKALAARKDRADAGLHLNLTVGAPLSAMPETAPDNVFPSMPVLSLKTLLFPAIRREVQAQIRQQIEAFRTHYGALPSYVDGHRHIHVLPGLRSALFAAITEFGTGWTPLVRSVEEAGTRIRRRGITPFKTMVISILSTGMRARAVRNGFGTNEGFAGVTDFDENEDLGAYMRGFLAIYGENPLIMVHPGLENDAEIAALDAVVDTRPLEHAYLAGPQFLQDLQAAGVRIGRLSDFLEKQAG